ncbi:MAG: sensor histidine kinase KdpD [Stagnimonas sp.]|nr:sensor histidine kinase KdpD [Stagnimonas sp.]
MNADARPNPDALLAHAQQEQRGKLKIFLGMAPGVGKTFEMLTAARKKMSAGVDVVVGIVETHGRRETMALVDGLDILPRRIVPYQGRELGEFDLDAMLLRRPRIALIDELAHTNAEGSRHPKRYQDVEELLDNGIDVYSTLNVQHVESLNDVVASITRVRVRETVPDDVLDAADEIELIDLTPIELIERLKEGKVYGGDGGERALQGYFTPANLTALRELALRRTAERVDDQLQQHRLRQGIRDIWAAGEYVLVCVNESAHSEQLVRAARRLADRLNAPWTALYLETERSHRLPETARDRVAATLRLAEELGAETRTLPARIDLAEDVLDYAREHNYTQIVIGKSRRPRWFEWLHGSVVDALVRKAAGLTVVVIAEADTAPSEALLPMPFEFEPGPPRAYVESVVSLAAVSALGYFIDSVVDIPNISLIYLPIILSAAVRYGLAPALVTALLATLAYNFCFTEPVFTMHIANAENIVALAFFGVIAVLTSRLTVRVREQTLLARAQADTTATLLAFARRMAGIRKLDELASTTAQEIRNLLRVDAVVLMPDGDGRLALRGAAPAAATLNEADLAAAQWAFEKAQVAGRGSETLPGAKRLFVPVRTGNGVVAVTGVSREEPEFQITSAQRRLLESIGDLAAVGVERVRLAKDVDQAKVTADQERLRASMLTAVSHDLRTPLAGILGALSSVRAYGDKMPPAERAALLLSAEEETQRLARFVGNLLDLTRLDAGSLTPKTEAVQLPELVHGVLRRMRDSLDDHPIVTKLPADLPALWLDPALFEHVLTNLLDNAAKYTPEGSTIEVIAQRHRFTLTLEIRDRGAGIPADELGKIFDLFHRVRQGDKARAGTGLGLAIARGFMQAMGGSIKARNRDDGGAVFEIEFPARLIVNRSDAPVATP